MTQKPGIWGKIIGWCKNVVTKNHNSCSANLRSGRKILTRHVDVVISMVVVQTYS